MAEGDRAGAGGRSGFLLESWLDLGDAIEQHPELRKLLFDPVTGLPTTPLLFPRISTLLEERGEVSLLYVNVIAYSRIEEIYGWRVFDDVMRQVAEILDVITGETLRDSDVIAELMNSGNAFVIVLSPPRMTANMDPGSRLLLARRVEDELHERLEKVIEPALAKKFGCFVGAATALPQDGMRLERLVYDALERAHQDSLAREQKDQGERVARLRAILDGEHIRTMVQPLFDMKTMEVIGYEALSRGPEGSEFEHPDKLFGLAYDSDLVLRLERVCRGRALSLAADLPPNRLLFLNIEPNAVGDPQLREVVSSTFGNGKVAPSRVVLEITERAAIADFATFRSTLDYLRTLGFGIAVDDAGAGYGSLQVLAEVRPEWLKIDMSLVRGCDSDHVRSSLVASLVSFANNVGANLVAEGIETEEELATLRELGVHYGQGFLLALPYEGFPEEDGLPAKRFAG